MRIVVASVAVLYVLAAFYGYFWWSESHQNSIESQVAPTTVTAPLQVSAEQLQVLDLKPSMVKPVEVTQLIAQQIQGLQTTFDARLQQLQTQQATTLLSLQKQIDELKQQQAQSLAPAQPSSLLAAQHAVETEPPPTEQILEQQKQQAKRSLKTHIDQLNLKLQTDTPDVARQSIFQQKVDDAFNQAELASLLQARAECGQVFCKLDVQGQVPTGVDPLQALWERNVFPESTEVMTVPKPDGSGWLVYIAAEGQSLATAP